MNKRIQKKVGKRVADEIDKMTSKLSSNLTITSPQQLDKWAKENDD